MGQETLWPHPMMGHDRTVPAEEGTEVALPTWERNVCVCMRVLVCVFVCDSMTASSTQLPLGWILSM